MPRKAKGKRGGRPIQPPRRPAPPPSSSEEDDEEMGVIRSLIARMEVLEKAKGAPSDGGAGPSGGGGVPPPKVPRRTRGSARSQLLTSLSIRLATLEKGTDPAGPPPPGRPVAPSAPVSPSPGQPAPVLPLPAPSNPVPELPLPSQPDPAAPVDQPPADPTVPVPLDAGGAGAPVLMCGHSLVFWAFKRASTSHWGSQLGFGRRASVYWLSMRGMLWNQLLPAIEQHLVSFPIPSILVLHLGENDLGWRTGLSIVQQASADIALLQIWMPGVRVLWVNWIQRRVWQNARCGLSLERARRKTSAAISKLILAAGGGCSVAA
ncbi:WW domain-binding protein 11-like isoform X1 [Hemicordylus capensis]|uniref:WW domain-binding protein 11-like isoform X1 n=1 Tax=Hemicordylus capensis TaxID=884348 RepID=UPI002302D529|nr:WW domain-binding protein 11-like isoform X1 [Hemicordylus capensis]